MLAKFLLIGTGGSGGKSLSAIRTSLERRLRYAGWEGGLPAAWQFVWIDTITIMPSISPFKPLPNTDYLGLTPNLFLYPDIFKQTVNLANSAGGSVPIRTLGGWVPKESEVKINPGLGAGQSRAIGRAISASQLKIVRERIGKAVDELEKASTDTELVQVARALNLSVDNGGQPLMTQAIIFGSSAGGTGSGIFMDVAEAMMSASKTLASNHRTILYAPDVFNSLEPAARKEVQPNGLGTIAEVLSGTWSTSMPPEVANYFTKAGVQPGQDGFGPKRVYLMGSKNSAGVYMGDQDDVYLATGEAISAIITSEELQMDLLTQRETNAFDKSGNKQDNTRLKNDPSGGQALSMRQPLSSIGFSRLSVGTDRLSEFISESMGKVAVQQLLWPAYEPLNPEDPKTPSELIQEKVARLFASEFLPKSGLNERDPSNDIIEALQPADSRTRMASFASNLLQNVRQQEGKHGLAPSQWVSGILDFYNRNRDAGFVNEEINAVNERARLWSATIEQKIVDLTAEFAAREGLQVAQQLIFKLREEVEWVCENELKRDEEGFQRFLGDMPGAVSQALMATGMASVQSTNPLMQNALSQMESGLRLHSSIICHQVANELLRDLCQNLLKPLENALTTAQIQLSKAVNDKSLSDGTKNPWPEVALLRSDGRTVVPARYQPAATELLLIDPPTYPNVIETQIKLSVSSEQGVKWLDHTIVRAILGQELADPITSPQSLIRVSENWISEKRETRRSASANAAAGKYEILGDPWGFIDRIGKWVLDPNTTLGKFLLGNLTSYLENPDPVIAAEREKDFFQKFQLMIAKSAPLADVNHQLAAQVHGEMNAKRGLQLSKVPFDPASPIGSRLVQLLDGIEYQRAAFQAGSVISEITAFEVLDAMSPVVFDSIMKGIATDWNIKKGDKDGRAAFWNLRRTLPLTQSIPASQAMVDAVVQGWFVAFLLGQIKVDLSQQAQFGPKVEVWDPYSNGYVSFPFPFLGRMDERADYELISSVLASLPLALLDVNSAGNLEPLRAYWRLSDLGASVHPTQGNAMNGLQVTVGAISDGSSESNTPIGRWISLGSVDSGAPIPSAAIAGADTPESRKQSLSSSVNLLQEEFGKRFDSVEDQQKPFNPELPIPQVYELKDVIISALKTVATQIKSI